MVEFEATGNETTGHGTSQGYTNVAYVSYVFVPLLGVLGVVGNLLTIRVMLMKSFRYMPVSKILIAMSLSDIAVNLMIPFNKPFMSVLLGRDVRAISTGSCRLFFWMYRFAKFTSSWMVVLISCERFVAVWLHVKAKTINTTRNAYIAIAVVCAILAAYLGYLCSWADFVVAGKCIPNASKDSKMKGFLLLGLTVYGYIPAASLLILNGMIVYRLVQLKKKQNKPEQPKQIKQTVKESNKDSTTKKTTVMLLSVAIAFVVLEMPIAINHIVSFVKKQSIFETTDPGMVFYREVSMIMEQLNHSINFIMYVMASKRFRDRVVQIFIRNRVSVMDGETSLDETKTKTSNK